MSHHSSRNHGRHSSSHGKHQASKSSQSGRHSDKHRSPKSSKSDRSETAFTFLFVVNEVHLKSPQTVGDNPDMWGTIMPQEDPAKYSGETVGTVFRYCDGRVDPAHEYVWSRDNHTTTGLRPAGHIYPVDEYGARYGAAEEYSTFTVFNCWRPLPCVYVEADPMSTAIGKHPGAAGHRWNIMGFENPDGTGITRIAAAGTSQVVAGWRPSWMPSLVPEMFANPYPRIPHSAGLAGALPVIIGQMALTHPPGQTDMPFLNQLWNNRRWAGQNLQAAVRFPQELRGVLVHVALDPENFNSTFENLELFELDVIVRE